MFQERFGLNSNFGRYSEVQLAVSIEAFLNHRWDWSDFRAIVAGDEDEDAK